MHEGHRKRMAEKLNAASDALQDHELLEILLFNAIPRKNTNPIAHELITAFGSLRNVFSATAEELLCVKGVGVETANYIICVGKIMERAYRSKDNFPERFTFEAFSDYLKVHMRPLQDEILEIFCLDKNERIKFSKRFTSNNEVAVMMRAEDVNRFLATCCPYGIVVAHNHPKNSCAPSPEDDRFTAKLMMQCTLNNIIFFDHIIVGNDNVFSYYRIGKIDEYRKKYNASNLFK